jgi:hypothetical protein
MKINSDILYVINLFIVCFGSFFIGMMFTVKEIETPKTSIEEKIIKCIEKGYTYNGYFSKTYTQETCIIPDEKL